MQKQILTLALASLFLYSCASQKSENEQSDSDQKPTETVSTPIPVPQPEGGKWPVPKPMSQYQIMSEDDGSYVSQLKPGTSVVTIEGMTDNDAQLSKEIKKLHDKNVLVICYHSLSYEHWRSDAAQFPSAAKGKKMAGWNELWTDTRPSSPAHAFWDKRYLKLKSLGCDCVEDDNEVDPEDNATGFPLSRKEAAESNAMRALAAHNLGMCHVAKNDPSMAKEYAQHSDAVYIEEAGEYGERDKYIPYQKAGKFGAMIEYSSSACKPYPGFSVQLHKDNNYFNGKNFKVCD